MHRREFMAASACTLAAPFIASGASEPLLKVGLVADAQYADIESKGTRFYRESIGKLTAAVDHFNGLPLDFCVHLGDLIDREWNSFDAILKVLTPSQHRFHHLLGNHDFEVLEALKPKVPGRMGMQRRYSHFDQGGFRFIILDTTEVSTYATVKDSAEQKAAEAELQRLEALKLAHAKAWNSGIGEAQLKWFDAACEGAGKAGLKVIVFAHHPVLPEGTHNVWNNQEVVKVIERHPQVVAWLNGHNHAGGYAERNGVPFITMHGMVETVDTTAFAVAELHADRLVIAGHGREPSREIVFRG